MFFAVAASPTECVGSVWSLGEFWGFTSSFRLRAAAGTEDEQHFPSRTFTVGPLHCAVAQSPSGRSAETIYTNDTLCYTLF